MTAAVAARSLGKLKQQNVVLFVCDLQERFRPVITGFPAVVDTARRMVSVMQALARLRHWPMALML